MVEALEQNVSAAAASLDDDEDLLSGIRAPVKASTAAAASSSNNNPALDESYEETQMNPNGFFNECNDQVSCGTTLFLAQSR